jgi:hypothetical protein
LNPITCTDRQCGISIDRLSVVLASFVAVALLFVRAAIRHCACTQHMLDVHMHQTEFLLIFGIFWSFNKGKSHLMSEIWISALCFDVEEYQVLSPPFFIRE